jgi:NhaP-type Na+/H+ or K+/H+ antiporter
MCSHRGDFAIKNVSERLRHLISAESAANDGLAYPFLTIAIYLTVDATKREAIGHWLLVGCLCKSPPNHLRLPQETMTITDQVILGTFIGALLGEYSLSSQPNRVVTVLSQVWRSLL